MNQGQGARIGGGCDAAPGTIVIDSGNITAIGGSGAGIGGGKGNKSGGTVTANGGWGGAGIGAGFFENMSGTVQITGSPEKVTIKGGSYGAGIGGGCGDDESVVTYKGDMKGDVTIDCSGSGLIKITGGLGSAGIGGAYLGNMDGECYIRNGNIEIYAGKDGAGIGGGKEGDSTAGGEGGDVYIGGGTLQVFNNWDETVNDALAEAIGHGGQTLLTNNDPSGSIYISNSNNQTGKYMRVAYSTNKGESYSTAKEGDRTSKCHKKKCQIYITECSHKDYYGNSGFEYTFDDTTHTGECKYCGYTESGDHTYEDGSSVCNVCGYNAGFSFVFFNSDGGSEVATQMVVNGQKAVRPEDPTHEEGLVFKDWYEIMNLNGDLAAEPFDFENEVLDHKLVLLKAVWEEAPVEEAVIIKSANVLFQGRIQLAFTLTFPDSVMNDEGAYVTLEKAGKITSHWSARVQPMAAM